MSHKNNEYDSIWNDYRDGIDLFIVQEYMENNPNNRKKIMDILKKDNAEKLFYNFYQETIVKWFEDSKE